MAHFDRTPLGPHVINTMVGIQVINNTYPLLTVTADEADRLADELKEAARNHREENQPWNKAPGGSYALAGGAERVALKGHDGIWRWYVSGNAVDPSALRTKFILLKREESMPF